MSKTSTDLRRHALNGPTMGTRWSALFFAPPGVETDPIQRALQVAVDATDAQMSVWKDDSDLMRLNGAPVGEWIGVPSQLMEALGLALEIGRASHGAFDIGVGDAVRAWGFGPASADSAAIRAALTTSRLPAHEALDLDQAGGRARKTAPIALDLNGIAKGYGVDRLAAVLRDFGLGAGLVGIDGEMRALGLRPDGQPWTIAVEAPEYNRRAPHSVVVLEDAAIATSGDYRHWVEIGERRLSHTMDPARGAPLARAPASVTVVARTCAEADAWATALMVLGPDDGAALAERLGLDALFLMREADGIGIRRAGALFAGNEGREPTALADGDPGSSRQTAEP